MRAAGGCHLQRDRAQHLIRQVAMWLCRWRTCRRRLSSTTRPCARTSCSGCPTRRSATSARCRPPPWGPTLCSCQVLLLPASLRSNSSRGVVAVDPAQGSCACCVQGSAWRLIEIAQQASPASHSASSSTARLSNRLQDEIDVLCRMQQVAGQGCLLAAAHQGMCPLCGNMLISGI